MADARGVVTSPRRMDLAALKTAYKQCAPDAGLEPDDARYVPLDDARSIRWADVVERRIALADGPVQVLVSGGINAGKTTELRRLAGQLARPESEHLYPIWVTKDGALDSDEQVDAITMGIRALRSVRGLLSPPTVSLQNDLDGLIEAASDPQVRASSPSSEKVLDARRRLRMTANWGVAGNVMRSIARMLTELEHDCFQKAGKYGGVVLIFDDLDRTQLAQPIVELLRALEPIALRCVFVVPRDPALRGRVLELPLPRLFDRGGVANAAGHAAMVAVLRARVPDEVLRVLFGADWGASRDALVRRSGGKIDELLRYVRVVLQEGHVPARAHVLQDLFARRAAEFSHWTQGDTGRRLYDLARTRPSPATVVLDVGNDPPPDDLFYVYKEGDDYWCDVHPALPGLRPSAAPEPDGSGVAGAPAGPLLTHVDLTNVGPFEALSLPLRSGWNLLLGDNGCGKTHIVRAVALALAGHDPRAAVAAQTLLRSGAAEGAVKLGTTRGDATTHLEWFPTEVRVGIESTTAVQEGHWLALGFPAIRGITARSISGPAQASPPPPSAYDLLPLVEGIADARLDDTRQWIVNAALRADGNAGSERHRQLLARWFEILQELMPGLDFEYSGVDRETWQVLVRTADGVIPIERLSQGMVSTLCWIGTLLRRLYEAFPNSPAPERERALVLIDEIDSALHPSWQQRVVSLVRERFPNVQVIATSHSPLIASNMEPDEVVVLMRDDKQRITATRVTEPLRGYRADQVLTSGAFGLKSSRSVYATALLQRYAEALAQGVDAPETRARVSALGALVREEIASPPETVEERLALDEATRKVDEAVREHLAQADAAEIAELKAMIDARRSA